jgi:hypothetical protein
MVFLFNDFISSRTGAAETLRHKAVLDYKYPG